MGANGASRPARSRRHDVAPKFRPQLLIVGALLVSVQISIPLLLAKTPQRPDVQPIQYPRSRGPVSASVQVVEFSYFACPACKSVQGDLKELLDLYGDRLFYTFRHFPKFDDSQSVYAHIAAECASEQSAFWPYYDKLFAEQPVWHSRLAPKSIFAAYARELGLDLDRFEACFRDEETFKRIWNEVDQGEALGVTHTPTFLVGDRLFVGPTQFRKKGVPLIKKLLEGEA